MEKPKKPSFVDVVPTEEVPYADKAPRTLSKEEFKEVLIKETNFDSNFREVSSDIEFFIKVHQFLDTFCPDKFKEVKKILEDETTPREENISKNIDKLYEMYLILKKEGGFSNEELGVRYW